MPIIMKNVRNTVKKSTAKSGANKLSLPKVKSIRFIGNYTRDIYSPVRVSTRILSPWFTKKGT